MTGSPPAPPRPDVVARLRAAGCVFAEDEAELLVVHGRYAGRPRGDGRPPGRRCSRSSTFSAGPSSADCGSPSTPGCSARGRAPSSSPRRPSALARPGAVVVDLCCGTGAVGAVLVGGRGRRRAARRRHRPGRGAVRPCATSAPPAARCTRATSTTRCRTRCAAGSTCWSPTRRTCPTGSIGFLPAEARLHEPLVALDGGAGRARRPAPGDRRGAGLAGARRPRAGRDQRGAGGRDRRRGGAAPGWSRVLALRRARRHRGDRHRPGSPVG